MTTATVRELRYDFPEILKHLEAGEEISLTRHGKCIVKIIPAQIAQKKQRKTSPKTKPNWARFHARIEAMMRDGNTTRSNAILEQRKLERY